MDWLLGRFKSVNDQLGGQLAGVPFALSDSTDFKKFWMAHPKCTWSEVLGVEPALFAEVWGAIGFGRSAYEAKGLYRVNGCSCNDHGSTPYGRAVVWYTYGARLPRGRSPKNYHDPNSEPEFPKALAAHLSGCEAMSPKPSKKRSRGGAASTTTEEPTPTEELAPTEEPRRRVSLSSSKRPAEETPQRQGAQFEAPEETPIQHQTKRRRRFSRRVAVNPNDFSTELTDDEKAALYALIKRSQRTDEFGVATIQIPP